MIGLSIFLNVIVLGLVGLVALAVSVQFKKREDKSVSVLQVFQNMTKVNPALSFRIPPHPTGDIGDFVGEDSYTSLEFKTIGEQ